jgi:hypothetical protein
MSGNQVRNVFSGRAVTSVGELRDAIDDMRLSNTAERRRVVARIFEELRDSLEDCGVKIR